MNPSQHPDRYRGHAIFGLMPGNGGTTLSGAWQPGRGQCPKSEWVCMRFDNASTSFSAFKSMAVACFLLGGSVFCDLLMIRLRVGIALAVAAVASGSVLST